MADAKNYISWILSSFSDYLAAPVLEIGVGHGSWFQPTGTNTPILLGLHEAASFKHPDVLHQAGQRHGKWSGELTDRRLPLAQSREDRSPGRVRKSAEHMVKMRR